MAPRENGLDYDGIVSGPTIYAYVGGNPAGRFDFLGLCADPKHHYHVGVWTMCDAADAFNMLQSPNMSAPGSPQAVPGFTPRIPLAGNNPISQLVNVPAMTITNTTLLGHEFYPGTVKIQVSQGPGGFGSNVDFTGDGTSAYPLFNDAVGYSYFGGIAALLAQMCSEMSGAATP